MTEEQKTATAAAVERFNAIMALPETVGREATAKAWALTTDMTVEQIRGALLTFPASNHMSIADRAKGIVVVGPWGT